MRCWAAPRRLEWLYGHLRERAGWWRRQRLPVRRRGRKWVPAGLDRRDGDVAAAAAGVRVREAPEGGGGRAGEGAARASGEGSPAQGSILPHPWGGTPCREKCSSSGRAGGRAGGGRAGRLLRGGRAGAAVGGAWALCTGSRPVQTRRWTREGGKSLQGAPWPCCSQAGLSEGVEPEGWGGRVMPEGEDQPLWSGALRRAEEAPSVNNVSSSLRRVLQAR